MKNNLGLAFIRKAPTEGLDLDLSGLEPDAEVGSIEVRVCLPCISTQRVQAQSLTLKSLKWVDMASEELRRRPACPGNIYQHHVNRLSAKS